MSDEFDTTEVRLQRNDGSEEFNLKAYRVDTTVENNLVTDSIVSAVSREVVGGKLVLGRETYQISFLIQGMGSGDYPNSDDPDYEERGHDYGYKEEMYRASKEWGFTVGDGFDQLYYDGTWHDGIITLFNPTEDTEARKPRTYDAVLEFTYLDGYIS